MTKCGPGNDYYLGMSPPGCSQCKDVLRGSCYFDTHADLEEGYEASALSFKWCPVNSTPGTPRSLVQPCAQTSQPV